MPPLIRSIKTLLFGYPNIFGICLIKQKFFVWSIQTFHLLWPLPFLRVFERYRLSPKIRAKRVGVKKYKIYILKIQDTFVISSICQKCQDTQIKAFLYFRMREGTQRATSLPVPFLILKDKSSFIWVPWHFLHKFFFV